ncbi:hypothetical protein [Streptomyces sp. NPDC090022]|uniref:hypothetical protein n=1 Tax=Streptomyces sp. NPDC090022 TaxID=3365920 RepID=UPI00380B1EBF
MVEFEPFLVFGASPMWETVYVTASMLMGALLYFLGRRLHGPAWLLTLHLHHTRGLRPDRSAHLKRKDG